MLLFVLTLDLGVMIYEGDKYSTKSQTFQVDFIFAPRQSHVQCEIFMRMSLAPIILMNSCS